MVRLIEQGHQTTIENPVVTGIPRKIAAFIRWLSAPEQLAQLPGVDENAGQRRPSFVSWVFSGAELADSVREKAQDVPGQSFLRRVFAPETLRDSQDEPGRQVEPGMSFWRSVFSREELPKLKVVSDPDARQKTSLGWVLSPEICPTIPDPTRGPDAEFLRWVLSSEACPLREPVTHRQSVGFLRWLLSSEVCPVETAASAHRRRAFWQWLMAREKLTP